MIGPLRVLAFDHFFDQDLRALEAQPRLDVRRFPYQRLRRPAMRMMGKDVSATLQAYNRPELAGARARYAAWLAREVRRLYMEQAFDVVVLPSDTFFYVRTLPAAAHQLGIPVVVIQKETTISQATMDVFSEEMRREAPFLADFMTVCSRRQREFWIRAGTDPNLIEVTGQPRFDIYASGSPVTASQRPMVLYMTYKLDAYVPGVGRGMGLRTWESLRNETETALVDLARSGACDVVVKAHPQQDYRGEAARLAALAGTAWNGNLRLAAQDTDTRELIMATDIVVGFQTTALYEAVAARKRVIYAAWGDEYERYRSGLIAFHEAPGECIAHAGSPQMLIDHVTDPRPPRLETCRPWFEQALGQVDGHATDRVAERLVRVAATWTATDERRRLDSRRRQFAVGFLVQSLAAESLWTVAIPAANIAGEQRRVAIRRRRAREGRRLAVRGLRGESALRDVSRGGD